LQFVAFFLIEKKALIKEKSIDLIKKNALNKKAKRHDCAVLVTYELRKIKEFILKRIYVLVYKKHLHGVL